MSHHNLNDPKFDCGYSDGSFDHIETEEQFLELFEETCNNLPAFCKLFFPDRFYRPFSEIVHGPMFELADSQTDVYGTKDSLCCPRGIGKTSIMGLAFPLREILWQRIHYLVYITSSSDLAEEKTEDIKNQLETHPLITRFFPSFKSSSWSKTEWITSEETGSIKILPRGVGQKVRGLLHNGDRPDLLIIDDIECEGDKGNIDTPEKRRKVREWFFGAVNNCIDAGSDNWRMIFLGTILHQDALLARLQKNPNWRSFKVGLADAITLKSNWPEFQTTEQIKHRREELKAEGMLSVFAREVFSEVTDSGDLAFNESMFQPFLINELNPNTPYVKVVIVDLAGSQESSDNTAILCVFLDLAKQSVYFVDLEYGKFTVDECVEKSLQLCFDYNCQTLGIEVTNLEQYTLQPFRNEISSRMLPITIVPLKTGGRKKEDRIKQLIPWYRKGYIKHSPAMAPLENELLAFPHSAHDDASDCAAYAILFMAKGLLTFGPKDSKLRSESIERQFVERRPQQRRDWRVA